MYDKYVYAGMKISEWVKVLHNEFSPGEIYQMVKRGVDLTKMTRG